MLFSYLGRGAKAGLVGGLVYGLFIALVGNGLVAFAETFEEGHAHDAAGPVVSQATTVTVSTLTGVLWGVFLGIVAFGLVYYFLEPMIPGARDTKSYLLGAAGFITMSGAPWLILPPQPPGIEQTLGTDVRTLWYAGAMALGGLACLLSLYGYNRFSARKPVALVPAAAPFALLVVLVLVAPANQVTGPIPEGLAVTFRWAVAFGTLLLWIVIASTHAWLVRRSPEPPSVALDDAESPTVAEA
jgi:predicted cobalt transporter CbtA